MESARTWALAGGVRSISEDTKLGRQVALKVLPPDLTDNVESKSLFANSFGAGEPSFRTHEPKSFPRRAFRRYESKTQPDACGMGELYLALDVELDRTVAIKISPAALASDQWRLQVLYRIYQS